MATILEYGTMDRVDNIYMFANFSMSYGINFGLRTQRQFDIAYMCIRQRMDNWAKELNCLDSSRTW